MNARETAITQLIKSRPFALVLILAAIAVTMCGAMMCGPGIVRMMSDPSGIIVVSPLAPGIAPIVCMGLNVVIMVAMALLNGQYNLLRTTSWLFLALWMVAQSGSPEMMTGAATGLSGCLALLLCVWISFSIYQHPEQTKRVFLLFFIITSLGCFNWSYLLYLPVFFIGMVQMQAMSMRGVFAALVGVATPVWLLWAFSIVDFHTLPMPEVSLVTLSRIYANPVMGATLAFTLPAGLLLTGANMVKVYGYNAVTRSHNGLLLLVWIMTALLCVVDFNNLWATLPLLNCTTAFQAGLFFRIYARRRAYLPVIIMIAAYTALLVWTIIQPNI